ncbi:MAG: YggS family pyridoxal phosphate-dependent enzyme [Marinicella sp.]
MTQQNTEILSVKLAEVKHRIEQTSRLYHHLIVPKLLAVSKKHPAEKIEAIYKLGQKEFGENYVQEALEKIQQLNHLDIIWHFIGPIQSNKTRAIAENFDWVQSVDRMKILTRLNNQRPESLSPLNVLLQYKVGDENSKSGACQSEILDMLDAANNMIHVNIRGLMCIPPPSNNRQVQCSYFSEVMTLFKQLKSKKPLMDTLSMGMSADLEAAIEMGTTMVRVGTDIFGSRC